MQHPVMLCRGPCESCVFEAFSYRVCQSAGRLYDMPCQKTEELRTMILKIRTQHSKSPMKPNPSPNIVAGPGFKKTNAALKTQHHVAQPFLKLGGFKFSIPFRSS